MDDNTNRVSGLGLPTGDWLPQGPVLPPNNDLAGRELPPAAPPSGVLIHGLEQSCALVSCNSTRLADSCAHRMCKKHCSQQLGHCPAPKHCAKVARTRQDMTTHTPNGPPTAPALAALSGSVDFPRLEAPPPCTRPDIPSDESVSPSSRVIGHLAPSAPHPGPIPESSLSPLDRPSLLTASSSTDVATAGPSRAGAPRVTKQMSDAWYGQYQHNLQQKAEDDANATTRKIHQQLAKHEFVLVCFPEPNSPSCFQPIQNIAPPTTWCLRDLTPEHNDQLGITDINTVWVHHTDYLFFFLAKLNDIIPVPTTRYIILRQGKFEVANMEMHVRRFEQQSQPPHLRNGMPAERKAVCEKLHRRHIKVEHDLDVEFLSGDGMDMNELPVDVKGKKRAYNHDQDDETACKRVRRMELSGGGSKQNPIVLLNSPPPFSAPSTSSLASTPRSFSTPAASSSNSSLMLHDHNLPASPSMLATPPHLQPPSSAEDFQTLLSTLPI
ncbi:hypothetical protein JAAARDRAFT_198466 [Jaapia argillacea MUCL 33604]|uniref:Uncharacterized protein n=1 Tax=Jaapia argillacea MUCL 33604 TaxID=933084 RepID=A0A067PPP7_9AGAM|nr:hypothetical protein JAAARDRAFT_198466 [Jaapia argillacea MUCL 33604]